MKPKINPVWGYVTLALVILTLVLCIVGNKRGVLSVRTDAKPEETAETFFEDLVIGKYREADACLENYSSLGLESAAGSKRGAALLASYDYTLVGEPEQKGDQALQTVRLRYLNLNALEEELNTPLAVFEGEEGEEDRIVYPTLSELLEKPEKYYTFVELQVQLHYSEGQWRIVADDELLDALAGGK